MQTSTKTIGLGSNNAKYCVYIENIPALEPYNALQKVIPLREHDVYNIGQQTGNHWRKIFNIYAKLLFEVNPSQYKTWQHFRDEKLLQLNSGERLLFSAPDIDRLDLTKTHIIMGRTYAKKLNADNQCYWLSKDFAFNEAKKLIISPYFDYRQLSNTKIEQLANLIKKLDNQY